MTLGGRARRAATIILVATAACLAVSAPARAYEFSGALSEGDRGRAVGALQVRLAGWFPKRNQTLFRISGRFGHRTERAVMAFQRTFGLTVDGVAGPQVFSVLARLEDKDGSTAHFDYSEFWQHKSSSCSAKANATAGSFGGGMAAPRVVRNNVRKLMWRLEAIRAKGGGNPIGVNSAFRGVAYNQCIGGASLSQHLYGTAADTRMAKASNRRERSIARGSQFHGIGCYSNLSHNHFDLRIHNSKLPEARFWWWPDRDSRGRDLADDGRPCWGERGTRAARAGVSSIAAVESGVPGAGSLVPSVTEVMSFQEAAETAYLGGAD